MRRKINWGLALFTLLLILLGAGCRPARPVEKPLYVPRKW